MDNFTKEKIERAEDILEKLNTISSVLIGSYIGVTPDDNVRYGQTEFPEGVHVIDTISNAAGLICMLVDSWKEESEDKKTESHAVDILERLQVECPARYRCLSSIEVTPSSEKLTFWIPDNDVFEDPKPELLTIKKADPDISYGFDTLNRIIDHFDSYENVRLEKGCGTLDGIYLKYDNKIGCSFAFQFGEFIKALQNKEDSKNDD